MHRDVKPQNVIISETDSKAKLIDLGAAADLRVGINYVPNEYLLDPRYAPPQQYIMSTQTPRAPPVPVAAALSPILWRLNDPDRFDMFSVGVSLIQMVFAPLRNDNSLVRQTSQSSPLSSSFVKAQCFQMFVICFSIMGVRICYGATNCDKEKSYDLHEETHQHR